MNVFSVSQAVCVRVNVKRDVLRRAVLPLLIMSACISFRSSSMAQDKVEMEQPIFGEFSKFQPAIEEHFKSLPKYQENDIIAKGDVEPVFEILEKLDWDVDDRDEILKQLLDDRSYMVRELRSKKGRPFMRDLSRYPETYDRLDRFLRLKNGKKQFQGLLKDPDGYKLFEYMTTSKGGKVLGEQLSNSRRGRNFNKPTGKIYTAKGLIERLRESHTRHFSKLKAERDAEESADESK